MTAPSGEAIRSFLPSYKPWLILMDELMNYVSRNRKTGMTAQLYNFLQNLSEEARAQQRLVLVVSIPASQMEMSADDQADYDRFKKLLDRLGKAVIMSAEAETSEIIRRRLFQWNGLPKEADRTIAALADWCVEHRNQIPGWFPVDSAREAFEATYPFHPVVLSVFERKWQQLPRRQQTRGILRLLALWVSKAYSEGYKSTHRDPLIGLGTAPFGRPAVSYRRVRATGEDETGRGSDDGHLRQARLARCAFGPSSDRGDQEGPAASEGGHSHFLRVQRRADAGRSHCAGNPAGRGWT